jgi:phospholipid/cholesterol/gamma-HCH transport system substrate-binding protein
MNKHTQQFKVRLGLFVLGGLTLFVVAIFIIGKQQNLFNPVFKLSTTFYNVSGLQVGSNIRFSGIDVGTVNNIKIINDTTVWVDMIIQKEIQPFIKSDCEAGIGSSGLIGDRVLIIAQGNDSSPMVKSGQQIASNEPIETDDIMASLLITAGYTETITQQLADIMVKVNSGYGTLGRLIHDTLIAQNLTSIVENFQLGSVGVLVLIDSTKHEISNIMSSLEATANNAQVTTQQMEEIIVDINNGYGTLGQLISDTTIAPNLSVTMVNLKHSSHALNENMEALKHNFLFKKYFKKQAKAKEKAAKEQSVKDEKK